MRTRASLTRYLLTLVVLVLFVFAWRAKLHSDGSHQGFLRNIITERSWFPDLESRIRFGSPDTWRTRETHGSRHSEVVDPIAERTFYMLKTGAEVMWDRVPVHLETTFKRFPHHQIYADSSITMGDETVVDVISMIPEVIIGDWLVGYRKRRQQTEEAWGWAGEQVRHENSEGWQSDKFKNVPMILHAYRNAPKHCDWFIFADDDTYIHSQSLGSLLRDLDPRKNYYLGSAAMIRDALSSGGEVGGALLAANPNEPVSLWFAHGGSGIIVSRGAIESLFWDPQREDDTVRKYSEWAVHTCCGDAVFGFMMREELGLYLNTGVDSTEFITDPFQGEPLSTTQLGASTGGWCKRLVTWHHLEPWEIQKLYEWEGSLAHRKLSTEDGVLFSDVYHDLILPYIQPQREYWDNGAASAVYLAGSTVTVGDDDDEDKEIVYPTQSASQCQRACEVFPRCLGWRFEIGENNTCTLESDNIRLGKNAMSIGNSLVAAPVVSGWMIERIRAIRSGESCDALDYDMASDTYSDHPDEREGWYFRKLLTEQKGQTHLPVLEVTD